MAQQLSFLFLVSFFFSSLSCFASSAFEDHPFYVGALAGHGSTTWYGLVPSAENQNSALNMSTPIDVDEGGKVWGFFLGYELTPNFAVEGNYMHFPDATVVFDLMSLFSFDHNDETKLMTHSETYNVMGKLLIPISTTQFRVFSGAGVANLHRKDLLVDYWRITPTFALGLNYRAAEHVMAEINGNYTAGFGESQLNPSKTYFPFLYSVTLRLAYRF